MVEQVGGKPLGIRELSVARTATVPLVRDVTVETRTPTPADTASLSGTAAALAASPPVDADRVATIKKAIADGKFPILPTTIADRLLALKLQWNPNEPA